MKNAEIVHIQTNQKKLSELQNGDLFAFKHDINKIFMFGHDDKATKNNIIQLTGTLAGMVLEIDSYNKNTFVHTVETENLKFIIRS